MLDGGGGTIVNVRSGNEFGCAPGVAWYLAPKHGLYGLTKVASMEYIKQGIRMARRIGSQHQQECSQCM